MAPNKLSKAYLRGRAGLALSILLIAVLGGVMISALGQRTVTVRAENAHDLDQILVAVAEMSIAFEQIRVDPDSQRSEVDQARVGRAVRSGRQGMERVLDALRRGAYSQEAAQVLQQPTLNPIDELTDLFFLADVISDFQHDGQKTAKAAHLAAGVSRQVLPVLMRVTQAEMAAAERANQRQVYVLVVAACISLAGIWVSVASVLLPMERYIVASQEEIEAGRQDAMAASRAKSQFLATMSHEIRTPLNGVLGVNQLLQDGEEDPEKQQMLALAVSSGNALLQIINDILDLSKIEAGKLELVAEDFDAVALCREVVDLFAVQAREKAVSMQLKVASELEAMWVRGHAKQARQIVLNLVNNAVKFTDSGEIVVRLDRDFGVSGEADFLRVSIRDTGVGIAEDALDRVFGQFEQEDASTTARFGGTGLGLANVRRLAEATGGQVAVESTQGSGSIFTVLLPVEAAADGRSAVPADLDRTVLQCARVLVVDDNRVNQMVAGKMLEKLGCKVRSASDGDLAIRLASEWRPDVILMDVRMPGMDGLEATRRIRSNAKEARQPVVPIVGLSANAMEEHRREGLDAGMVGYLTKPLKRDALEAELVKQLHARNAKTKDEVAICR